MLWRQRSVAAIRSVTYNQWSSNMVRLLGVLISTDLSFDRHVTKVAGQSRQLRQLRSVRESLHANSEATMSWQEWEIADWSVVAKLCVVQAYLLQQWKYNGVLEAIRITATF